MDEYIKREQAIKIAEYYGLKNGSALGRHSGIADCIAESISIIPPADVAPVRHGRWKRYGKNLGECSECGEIVSVRNNYCPNCGAMMDGGAD